MSQISYTQGARNYLLHEANEIDMFINSWVFCGRNSIFKQLGQELTVTEICPSLCLFPILLFSVHSEQNAKSKMATNHVAINNCQGQM